MAKLSPARKLAAEVGAACRERNAFAGDVLDARLRDADLNAADKAFARVLVLGVAATWGTLDEVIDRCLNSPNDIQPDVRDALRVSTYELVFLRKDAHAAVDQGVALMFVVNKKASRLANAVLRKVARAAESFPFGDPATDEAALARLHGFPAWIARVLIEQMGREAAASFMEASNHAPALYLGVNAVKAQVDDVSAALSRAGFSTQPVDVASLGVIGEGSVPDCLLVPDATAVASRAARGLFRDGAILVSDAAAQQVACLALPSEFPFSFLEVGAGRGTKTVLLQSGCERTWGRQSRLTSVDDDAFKVRLIQDRARTYGVQLERAISADARDLSVDLGDEFFDAAFVDAPCSGLGTLRRHPEIRWRLTPAQVNELADTGLALLQEAARHVRVGGQLTYATCTVLLQENEFVVKRFLSSEVGAGWRILPYAQVEGEKPALFFKSKLSAEGCDAHFAARFVRVG